MAPQQIVLKVFISNGRDKTKVLQAATKLPGVTKVDLDADRGTVTVVGEVDPVLLTKQVRKAMKNATIVSVGPPRPNESHHQSNYSYGDYHYHPPYGNSPRLVAISYDSSPCYDGYGRYTLL